MGAGLVIGVNTVPTVGVPTVVTPKVPPAVMGPPEMPDVVGPVALTVVPRTPVVARVLPAEKQPGRSGTVTP